MADIKVQFVQKTIPDGSASVTATSGGSDFTELTDYTKAFIIPTSSYGQCGFGDFDGDINNNVTNSWSRASLDSNSQVTFTRGAAKDVLSQRCAAYIVEYTGPSGGENEFIVRQAASFTHASTDGETKDGAAISGISNIADCVPFCTISTSRSSSALQEVSAAYEIVNDGSNDVIRSRRDDVSISGTNTIDAFAVEFTGSNWTVSQVKHDFSSNSLETETISVSDITKTWLFSYGLRTNYNANEDVMHAWLADTTTLYLDKTNYLGGDYGGHIYVYLIENPELTVQNLNSDPTSSRVWTGSGSGIVTKNITVSTYDHTNAICWGEAGSDDATTRGTGIWRVKAQSATVARFTRGYDLGNTDYTLQVIDFSGLTSVTNTTITVPTGPLR